MPKATKPAKVKTIRPALYPALPSMRRTISLLFISREIFATRLNIRVAASAPGKGGAPEGRGSVASLMSCRMS